MRRVALVAGVSCCALVLALLVVGWRPVVLLSDSMAPGAPAGSLLLARPVESDDIEVGDVVTVPLDGDGRVTHRVIALEELDGTTWARLRSDANGVPDPGRVALDQETLRAVAVMPGIGRPLAAGDPLLLAGIGLLLVGTTGLALVERRSEELTLERADRRVPQLPTGGDGLDTRVLALLATLEALGADGMDPDTLEALGRARTGALLGLGAVEDSPHATELDDGARFVVVALADADPAALSLVPSTSRRAVRARAAVGAWWDDVADRVPRAVRTELVDVLADVARGGGIAGSGPVD